MNKVTTFLLMVLCVGLSGCVDELERDTSQLVDSVDKMQASLDQMEDHTGSIAESFSRLESLTEKTVANVEAQMEVFEDRVVQGIEIIQGMADSFDKIDRLVELADYIRTKGEQFGGLTETFEKIDALADQAQRILSIMDIEMEPTEAEQNIENFETEEDRRALELMMMGADVS